MLLFKIMYSYIISFFIIYLWYNYLFSFFSFTFKATSLLNQVGLLSGNMGLQQGYLVSSSASQRFS